MKIIFNKYGGLKTIEDRQLLVQSSSNANYVDIYYQDDNGNFADETVNLATIAFKRADSFEIMEKTCDAVREELTNKLLYFRYVFQEDDLAVNGELQITVRLKQVVFDPEDQTQILLIKQRAMGKLVAHIYEAIGTDYEYYNVIDGRLLQLELWQSTFDGNFYDVTQIDAIVAQEVLNRNNAINDHNNNANAHASIRQEITDLENDLQEQIDVIDDTLQNHESRIDELEQFAENLETNITEEIEDALDNKADLIDGKVPREQLPSFVDDIIEGFYIDGQFYSEGEESPEYLITPEFGKLYVDVDTNKMYRFLGGIYEEIPSPFELTKAKVEAVLTGDITSHKHSYNNLDDKPVSVVFEITSFTELTPQQKTTIKNQLMPLLNINLTDLDTNKYSDLILKYLDERYHYSSVAVMDGEVVRILFDYKNEDTKIKLDINFVGDDSQTVIELVTINFEPEGTVSTHNASEFAHPFLQGKIDEAKAIAEGKSRAIVFATEANLDGWLATPPTFTRPDGKTKADLKIGDNLYIEELDKPDYWWNGTTIKELETQKVDLTEYAKKTELLTLGTTENDAYRGDLGQIAYNHSQSDHAPSNAQANVIEGVQVNGVDLSVANKKVNVTVPTIPNISLNDDQATAGKYISKIEVDATNKHKLIVTKADLPQGFSGKFGDLTEVPDEFTPSEHNHDDRYYTESEVDTKLGGKADTTHNHTKSQITDFPTSMTPTAHNHTKSEITDFPTSMPPTAHNHDSDYYKKSETYTKAQIDALVGDLAGETQELKSITTEPTGSFVYGDKYYNSSTKGLYYYTGSTWELTGLGSPIEGVIYSFNGTLYFWNDTVADLIQIGGGVDLSNYYTKTEINAMFDNLLGGEY